MKNLHYIFVAAALLMGACSSDREQAVPTDAQEGLPIRVSVAVEGATNPEAQTPTEPQYTYKGKSILYNSGEELTEFYLNIHNTTSDIARLLYSYPMDHMKKINGGWENGSMQKPLKWHSLNEPVDMVALFDVVAVERDQVLPWILNEVELTGIPAIAPPLVQRVPSFGTMLPFLMETNQKYSDEFPIKRDFIVARDPAYNPQGKTELELNFKHELSLVRWVVELGDEIEFTPEQYQNDTASAVLGPVAIKSFYELSNEWQGLRWFRYEGSGKTDEITPNLAWYNDGSNGGKRAVCFEATVIPSGRTEADPTPKVYAADSFGLNVVFGGLRYTVDYPKELLFEAGKAYNFRCKVGFGEAQFSDMTITPWRDIRHDGIIEFD